LSHLRQLPRRPSFRKALAAGLVAKKSEAGRPKRFPRAASECRDYMISDIEPIFAKSPNLSGTLAEDGERNTLLLKGFAGGSPKIVAAKAPRNLRRHTCAS
jgi:Phage terminase large subunit (GpA)